LLKSEFGDNCERLTDAINNEVMKTKARRAGFMFTEKKLDNEATVLTINTGNQSTGGF
jgi:hypothetical protein